MTAASPLPALRLFTTCDDRGPRDEVLIRLLHSLRRSSEQGAEVHHYLLLQNCADPAASRLRLGLGEEVRLISDPGQLSLSRARNILMDTFLSEAKDDDVVAFPDDDAWYPDGFAVFGRVVGGMEVVRAILASPTSPTEGEGFMRGQMLEPKITILRAWRETTP